MTPREELKHVGQSFAEEPMETCRHCGDEWYSVHYKNGYCHSCQKKGLHMKGETIVFTRAWDKAVFFFAFALGIVEVVVSFCTLGLYGRLVRPNFSVRILTNLAKRQYERKG